ncbi:MAG TPA: hypothetical protein VJ831_14115 [Jatrophihabitantaceae bacterium]|nr:hypothetical protein [Jatrophihabitantaceae bacterium]
MGDDSGALKPSAMRTNVRGLSHMLAAPQGFTLSIAGTLAITVGHQHPSGWVPVWLFVVGAGVAFCATALIAGALRETMPMPVSFLGLALLNLVPAGVVPLATATSWWIDGDSLAFFVAGFVAVIGYVWGLAAFLALSERYPARSVGGAGRSSVE